MNAENPAIYERVTLDDRRKSLLQRLGSAQAKLILDWDMGSRVELEISNFDSEKEIFHILGRVPNITKPKGTFRFSIDSYRGYFESQVQQTENGTFLLLKNESLFVEQLRKDFRLVIPSSYPAVFEITSRTQGVLPLQVSVLDFTHAGASLLAKAGEKFQIGEKLEGLLQIGDRTAVALGGEIRFCRPNQAGEIQIGLEFDHMLFGSAANMLDLIGFYRFDLFQWRKSREE